MGPMAQNTPSVPVPGIWRKGNRVLGRKTLLSVGMALAAAAALAACKPAEQGRILQYKKGVYLGKTEAPLSGTMLKTLRARAAYQAGVVDVALAGGTGVRVPQADLDTSALRQRNREQRDFR